MISDIICDKLTQNPPIIPLNPPVSGANAANNFWKVSKEHPCPLSPHLGLWRMLEVPDWG